MSALAVAALSRDEARSLTDEVKGDAERLWRKLVELHEGGAHLALGYGSWHAYFRAEFGGSSTRSYQLLEAGRVMKALELHSNIVGMPANDRVARALAPLNDDPRAMGEAWEEATARAGDRRPTAAIVEEVVSERMPGMNRKATINANASKRKLYDVLSSIGGYCAGFSDFNLERALSIAERDDIEAWERLASESIRALNNLKRAIKEAK